MIIGNRDQLAFEHDGFEAQGSSSDLLRGYLRLWVAERSVWGAHSQSGFRWSWDALFEKLSLHWADIFLEETYPLQLSPVLPSLLWREFYARSDNANEVGLTAVEEDEIYEFDQAHDLSAWVAGVDLSPVILVRSGELIIVDASQTSRGDFHHISLTASYVESVLARLGSEFARKIREADDERAACLRDLWVNRMEFEHAQKLKLIYGTTLERAVELESIVADAANNNEHLANSFRVAARMLETRAPSTTIVRVIQVIRDNYAQTGVSRELDLISTAAITLLNRHSAKPFYAQGAILAR